MTRWNERQAEAARNLSVAPFGYVTTKFTVEEIGRFLFVCRQYRITPESTFCISETFRVGERGSVVRQSTNSY